uniref:Uncharacterized protein n=1 Tax=Ciona intestinalis TaxID=7719 RepID=F6STK4_CIOIN
MFLTLYHVTSCISSEQMVKAHLVETYATWYRFLELYQTCSPCL